MTGKVIFLYCDWLCQSCTIKWLSGTNYYIQCINNCAYASPHLMSRTPFALLECKLYLLYWSVPATRDLGKYRRLKILD
ncbi:hypothetical protein XELAEV_18002827mg [Xenopus laevis]|nr:hypothetical protein XELAEV_18002827mg [Xenopus laevis]